MDFKSSKKSLNFLEFFRIFRIFLSEQPLGVNQNVGDDRFNFNTVVIRDVSKLGEHTQGGRCIRPVPN